MPEPSDAGSRRTVSVPPERLSGWLRRFGERHGAVELVAADEHRLRLSAPDGATAELEVPFPPLPPAEPDRLAALVAHAGSDRVVGVLLVRRGGYAVGVFDGSRLLASKVGSGYVQGRTKAGGWSQQRFARRRANQAQALWQDAAEVAARLLLPQVGELAAVITGGDRDGVAQVLGDSRLSALRGLVAPPFLAVPDPRQAVLAATPEQFRAVRITLNDRA